MARRRRLSKYSVAKLTSTGPGVGGEAEEPQQQPAEKSVLFGTPSDRKTIAIVAGVGFVVMGLFHYLVGRASGGTSIAAILFTALHGALLGMLLGQLILVYPDRVVIIFTLLVGLVGELVYVVGTGRTAHFELNAQTVQAITAIFFWGGFVGFWIGFLMYTKHQKARMRFQQRIEDRAEEQQQLPPLS